MKNLLLLFFICIFSQNTFAQNEVLAEYYNSTKVNRLFRKPTTLFYNHLIIFNNKTFHWINGGGCLIGTDEGTWSINKDTLILNIRFENFDKKEKIKFLVTEKGLLSLNADNTTNKEYDFHPTYTLHLRNNGLTKKYKKEIARKIQLYPFNLSTSRIN
jgi:hypothetical protein